MLVLAAVDESPDSQQAVAWLERFLPPKARLLLLMCVPKQSGMYGGVSPTKIDAAQQACRQRFPGQASEVLVVPSDSSEAIGEAILERARQAGATLLALAPHGRSATHRVLHGSVTDHVCRHSRLPVLVVQGVAAEGGQATPAGITGVAQRPPVTVAEA